MRHRFCASGDGDIAYSRAPEGFVCGGSISVRESGAKRVRLDLLFGVITRAHQRPGLDVADALALAALLPRSEFVRMHPALDRQVLRRGLEVLAQRADVATDGDRSSSTE